MPPSFTITTPVPTIPASPTGRAEVNFTVANTSGVPARALVRIVPSGATRAEWFSIAGESERDFAVNGNQQFTVIANVPPDVPEGSYPFRVDVVSARKASEERVEGPVVTLAVPARTAPPPKKSYWWIIVAVIALLAVLGVVAYLATRPDEPVTDTTDTTATTDTTKTTDTTNTTDTSMTTGTITGTIIDLRVDVPNVINAPIAVAENSIRQAGLQPRRNVVTDDLVPAGNVRDQRPRPGEKAVPNTEVVLDVVSGPEVVTVPDLKGASWTKVQIVLQQLGLEAKADVKVGIIPKPGKVIEQDPPAGAKVRPGETVRVTIDGVP